MKNIEVYYTRLATDLGNQINYVNKDPLSTDTVSNEIHSVPFYNSDGVKSGDAEYAYIIRNNIRYVSLTGTSTFFFNDGIILINDARKYIKGVKPNTEPIQAFATFTSGKYANKTVFVKLCGEISDPFLLKIEIFY